jgi:hypothetical protein
MYILSTDNLKSERKLVFRIGVAMGCYHGFFALRKMEDWIIFE